MRLNLRLLAIVSMSIIVANCATMSNPDKDMVQAWKAAPPTFANAIERHAPQATVNGDFRSLLAVPLPRSDVYAEAEAYAESMESYAFLVWQGGEMRHAKFFAPYNQTLRPDSASMHKSVLALVVGAAIDDGVIAGLDEPVQTYLPEWADDPRGTITIRDLLQMSSGLQALSTEGGSDSPSVRFVYDGANALETVLHLPQKTAPGTEFHYANAVSQLLGLIVERASGRLYHDYLSERLWAPLHADDAQVWLNESGGFARTYSALMARAEDWLRVGLLIKDKGMAGERALISAEYIEAMLTPSAANPNYGFQIWLGTEFDALRFYNDQKSGFAVTASEPYAVEDLVFFDGFGGQRVYICPSMDLVIVRTGNAKMDWDDAILPNLVISALKQQ